MVRCRHTRWLRLARKDQGFILEVSDRAQKLLDGLPRPDEQTPSVVVLMGNQTKQRLLQTLEISTMPSRRRRAHGEIHLVTQTATVDQESPVVFAEGDMPAHNRLGRPWKPQLCHEVGARLFAGSSHGTTAAVASQVYHQLLLPFADAVCLFIADLGGIQKTVRCLAAWMDLGQPSKGQVRPRLILVMEEGDVTESLALFRRLMQAETQIDLASRFENVRVVALTAPRGRGKGACNSSLETLRREIADDCQIARQRRAEVSLLFTARHLAGFLQFAGAHAASSARQPFDFIRTSRLHHPVADDLRTHWASFMRSVAPTALCSFAMPMIASSILLDHYPPGMHLFNPRDVFAALYRDACADACKNIPSTQGEAGAMMLPSALVDLVEHEVAEQFAIFRVHRSAKARHQQVMRGLRQGWVDVRSSETCLCCLRRRPQFRLPCGHSVCESCVRVFGSQSAADPWVFHVDRCFLCCVETGDVRIKVKPATAGVRVLSIDGGGTRGRAPLEFFRIIQDRVRLPCSLQQHFDVVYGTSSGAIIACALFLNGWPVDDCIASFERLARLAFTPRPRRIPFLSGLYELFRSLLYDSRYPAENLEAALRAVFGPAMSITDCSAASATGAMVGVPVTTIRDVSPCVFTSYNDVGKRETSSGETGGARAAAEHGASADSADYHVLRPEAARGPVPLWEILRCATAAPYYFKPRHIEGLGTFQDGGLIYNNPVSIAIQEAVALFPDAPEPSLIVSLGTGSGRTAGPDTSEVRRFWRDSFLLRVFRAFWQQGDSRRAWQQLLSRRSVGKAGECFRFDIEFEGPEPALDDVSVMQELGNLARETMLDSPALDRLVLRIRAECFIFELDPNRPVCMMDGTYECVGRILCRLRAGTPEFEALMAQLDQASAAFLVGDTVLPGRFQDRSARLEDGNFCKEVRLCAAGRSDPLSISLRESGAPCPISGAPFTLQRLTETQKLEARFGTADHRKRTWPAEPEQQHPKKRVRRC